MWPVLMEYLMSVTWAYAMLVMATLWLAGLIIELPPEYRVPSLLSGWNGVMVGTTCLMQISVPGADVLLDTLSAMDFSPVLQILQAPLGARGVVPV